MAIPAITRLESSLANRGLQGRAPSLAKESTLPFFWTNSTFYVDGVQKDSQAQPAPVTLTHVLAIGIRPSDCLRGFDGSIDDVRMYRRALSVTEIKQLYNMGW